MWSDIFVIVVKKLNAILLDTNLLIKSKYINWIVVGCKIYFDSSEKPKTPLNSPVVNLHKESAQNPFWDVSAVLETPFIQNKKHFFPKPFRKKKNILGLLDENFFGTQIIGVLQAKKQEQKSHPFLDFWTWLAALGSKSGSIVSKISKKNQNFKEGCLLNLRKGKFWTQ